LSGLRLLSGTEGMALAAASNGPTEAYYVVLADGTSRKIATEDRPEAHAFGQAYGQRFGIWRSAATTLPNGEARFAVSVVAGRLDLACAMEGHVSIFSSKGPLKVDTSLGLANRAKVRAGLDGALAAPDLWWDDAGDLHSVVLNDTCGADNVGERTSSITEWMLHGDHWQQVSNEQVRGVRQLDSQSRIVLLPRTSNSSSRGYDLYLDQDGRKKVIAKGVGLLTTEGAFPTSQVSPVDPCRIDDANCPKLSGKGLQRLYAAPVPSVCGHPAGSLEEGSLPGLPENEGFVTLRAKTDSDNVGDAVAIGDLTGDGVDETVAVVECSRGGVSWPENIVLYSSTWQILGAIDLGDVFPDEHADVERLRIVDGEVLLTWIAYEGAGFCLNKGSMKLHWDGQSVMVRDLAEAKNIPMPVSGC
jgi:hypothetical protein